MSGVCDERKRSWSSSGSLTGSLEIESYLGRRGDYVRSGVYKQRVEVDGRSLVIRERYRFIDGLGGHVFVIRGRSLAHESFEDTITGFDDVATVDGRLRLTA